MYVLVTLLVAMFLFMAGAVTVVGFEVGIVEKTAETIGGFFNSPPLFGGFGGL